MREKLFDIIEELLLKEKCLMSYDKRFHIAELQGEFYVHDFFDEVISKLEERLQEPNGLYK